MIEFEDAGGDDEEGGGAPAWMATFADLMSLLMCFFVLLLSFSEMDVLKYKQIAGSMRNAFGVQNEVNVRDIPKGTSVIAREFSPGRPDPTPLTEVRQHTTDSNENSLDTRVKTPGEEQNKMDGLSAAQTKQLLVEKLKKLIKATEDDAQRLISALDKEVMSGEVAVKNAGRTITLRIRERGSFASGSATLQKSFVPVMAKVRYLLRDIRGKIAVEGHTDDIPISTSRFRSNWDLSSARALAVAHELFKDGVVSQNRFLVSGYADTRPAAENDSPANRAMNRRVEIVIRQGLDSKVTNELKALRQEEPDVLETLNLDDQLNADDLSAIESLL